MFVNFMSCSRLLGHLNRCEQIRIRRDRAIAIKRLHLPRTMASSTGLCLITVLCCANVAVSSHVVLGVGRMTKGDCVTWSSNTRTKLVACGFERGGACSMRGALCTLPRGRAADQRHVRSLFGVENTTAHAHASTLCSLNQPACMLPLHTCRRAHTPGGRTFHHRQRVHGVLRHRLRRRERRPEVRGHVGECALHAARCGACLPQLAGHTTRSSSCHTLAPRFPRHAPRVPQGFAACVVKIRSSDVLRGVAEQLLRSNENALAKCEDSAAFPQPSIKVRDQPHVPRRAALHLTYIRAAVLPPCRLATARACDADPMHARMHACVQQAARRGRWGAAAL